MNRMTVIVLAGLAIAAMTPHPVPAQGLSWNEFFAKYCATGSNTCLPTASTSYRLGKTVQETADDITAYRAGAIPVFKLSTMAAVVSYEGFLDLAVKLSPADLNRGQTEFKDKPDALLAKLAEIRGQCGAVVSILDRRTCYEQAMAAIIPGRKP